jgi:hypothetical protein
MASNGLEPLALRSLATVASNPGLRAASVAIQAGRFASAWTHWLQRPEGSMRMSASLWSITQKLQTEPFGTNRFA